MVKKKAYIAGPLFNEHERWYLEKIDQICRTCGLDTFLPHRDTRFASEADAVGIFDADLKGLDGANLVVALLDGQDIDSGTSTELGIAYKSIPRPAVVGITTDVIRRAYSNAMPYAVCLKSLGIASSLSELAFLIAEYVRKSDKM